MPELTHDFPRWGLANLVIHEVEDELASLPMVLLTPILSAILATTLAVSLPASHVHDGTVEGPSVLLSIGLAVAGAVSGSWESSSPFGSGVAISAAETLDSGLAPTIPMETFSHSG